MLIVCLLRHGSPFALGFAAVLHRSLFFLAVAIVITDMHRFTVVCFALGPTFIIFVVATCHNSDYQRSRSKTRGSVVEVHEQV